LRIEVNEERGVCVMLNMKTPAFGIDLGTTNSAIAVVGNGNKPEVLKIDGKMTMPSCVLWDGERKFVVGSKAYSRRGRSNVVYSVKRLMGTDDKICLRKGKSLLYVEPWEVSKEILSALVSKARIGIYKEINDVVITVPAYFNNKQIDDTMKAGVAAGLNVLSIMREPTAACLVYNQQFDVGQSKKVMLYDLGGGTFDVSVVLITSPNKTMLDSVYGLDDNVSDKTMFSVLKVDGDTRLGGDDVDEVICKNVLSRMVSTGIKESKITKEIKEKVLLRVEMAKKAGIGKYVDEIRVGKSSFKVDINPIDFIAGFEEVYKKTKRIVDRVLSDPIVGKIDQIITVGGSTKSEVIQDFLKRDFPGIHINSSLNPDESVALGAAIQAKRVKFGDDSMDILDCLGMDIGVASEGYVESILKAGMQIPCQVTRSFVTDKPGQDVIDLDVFQGNSRYFEECEYLGRLTVSGVKISGDKHSRVMVRLSLDSNGMLVVESQAGKSELERKELVNVSRLRPVSSKVVDKRVVRWRAFAARLGEVNMKVLLNMIDSYLEGKLDPSEIVEFISLHKEKKEIQREFSVLSEVEGFE
jgi:molecular chaperone DnaK